MFDEEKERPEDERPREAQDSFGPNDGVAAGDGVASRVIRSKYEFVMAASKEAERLNDRYRNTQVRPATKVTIEAVDRVRKGLSRISYEEPGAQADEGSKESTYFFGS